jgi:hypothetical protein
MSRHVYACSAALFFFTLSSAASAADEQPSLRLWSGNHAPTVPQGRLELGLFQSAHYGLSDRVEVSLHPLWFFVLPHVEAKALAAGRGRFSFAVRGRLSYPTLFLKLVSKAGAGGLLPKQSSPPQAVQVEGDVLGSALWAEQQMASVTLGLAVAPHGSFTPQELPLLDFPFLYPRFAPLYSVVVPRAALSFEGRIWRALHYDASVLGYLMPQLPDVGTAYAVEEAGALEYRFGQRVAISLGLRVSEAKYAYANLVHFLPYADVRVGF